jgi:DNA-directed RNA polymerase subunit RPC12/RpoP
MACGYCGADFTIHETDLETICPGCLARVSDRARFCHHCATPLAADVLAGESSQLECPVCEGRRLYSRRLPDASVTVLECRVCAGMWIGLEAFHDLLNAEERRKERVSVSHRRQVRESKERYRKCPSCKDLMIRRNLGAGQSGVVVDVCGEHGLWFDCDELSHTIAWIRTGGLEGIRRDVARLKGSPDIQRKRQVVAPHEVHRPKRQATGEYINLPGEEVRDDLTPVLVFAAELLASIFSRQLR